MEPTADEIQAAIDERRAWIAEVKKHLAEQEKELDKLTGDRLSALIDDLLT